MSQFFLHAEILFQCLLSSFKVKMITEWIKFEEHVLLSVTEYNVFYLKEQK